MAAQGLETQRYHLVAFTSISSGSVPNGDGSPSESILEVLNETSDSEDCDKSCDSKEYNAAMKEFEDELALEKLAKKQTTAKQVFVTNRGDDGEQGAADLPPQAAKDKHQCVRY
jgi:hypothetical protein